MITVETQATNDTESITHLLTEMNARLTRIDEALVGLSRRVDALDELAEDLMPMANGMFKIASHKLGDLEQKGALEFGRETIKLAETVATEFTAEDVKLLGANLVGILETVRNMTQPDVLEVADRAVDAFREAEAKPPQKVRLFKALRDPEIRRGMGMMLSVLREMGTEQEPETNGSSGSGGVRAEGVET